MSRHENNNKICTVHISTQRVFHLPLMIPASVFVFCCFDSYNFDYSVHTHNSDMPKVRRSRKAPPEGWELIEPTLEELEQKMREGIRFRRHAVVCLPFLILSIPPLAAETEGHEGKRINESLWPIFKIHHQKSRYIYDLFYRRKAISRELFDYCVREKIADANLIAKWKKSGYENLCCLRCIQTRDTNFGTNCICRVPKAKLEEGRVVECVHCGCRGCSG